VDNEVEVTVRGDMVFIRTLSGQNARDDGSECNAPLPRRDIPVGFEVKDSRNEIRLVAPPDRRNDYAAIVHIRDTDSGFGRYHFRLEWDMNAAIAPPPEPRRDGDRRDNDRPGPGGFAWNNVINFHGFGRGQSNVNDYGPVRLGEVNVDIDRGGKMVVSFRVDRGRPLLFRGSVMNQEGGRIRADVASEDGRLRGPMFISVDARQNVISITLEATDGRDRMKLNWDRR
jgi:hypothetical protein